FRVIIVCLGLWLILDLASHLGAEIFWFQEVGYLPTFLVRLITQGALWVSVVSLSMIYLLGNLILAKRWQYPQSLKIEPARIEKTTLSRELTNFLSPQYKQVYHTPQIATGNTQIKLFW
ncbi:MAG: UPF0182 family protein, partial [Sphaerospermopsis kisseleviana]